MLSVLGINKESVVDGEGLRSVIYFAGCPFKCYNCQNPESWNIANGKTMSIDDIVRELPYKNVTFSGGEPLYSLQIKYVLKLAKILYEKGFNIWCYTGYTIEEIREDEIRSQIFNYVDVIVDGKYIDEMRNVFLPFRNSSNQRILRKNIDF